MKTASHLLTATLVALFSLNMSSSLLQADERETAADLVRESGVSGGLIVHVGCGDADWTAALRINDRYIVQGLETDAGRVAKARESLRETGMSGAVSVIRWTGERLPYVDDLVNLVIRDAGCKIRDEEIQRVLVPGGVALALDSQLSTLDSCRKPWPVDIDEWQHFLHGPDNNAVAEDTRVAPPHHMQWVAGPRWARSHDHMASMSAAVSAAGRLFYIVDEGPIASVSAPSRWMLIARDAFNGVLLWKKAVEPWEDQLRPFRSGPTELPRRLVASGARVYVTLGYAKPLVALDAATGDLVETYAGTENTHEILVCHDKLFLVVSDPPAKDVGTSGDLIRRLPPWTGRDVYRQYVVKYPPRRIQVVDLTNGKIVWQKKDEDTEHLMPTTLAVSSGQVFFQNEKHIVALEADSGEVQWRAERPVSLHRPAFASPTLVVKDGVVLSADRSPKASAKTGGEDKTKPEWLVSATMISTRGEIIAFSAETGQQLWSAPCHEAFNSPVDIFVAGGKVWSGVTSGRGHPGITKVYDLHTGEVTDNRPKDQECFTVGFAHGRCYRNKATTKYVLHGRAGVEFVDMASNDIIADHWIRGTCQYGILPCNGLLYVPPHSCACYNEAKLDSFNVLAPAREKGNLKLETRNTGDAFETGPAYEFRSRLPGGGEDPSSATARKPSAGCLGAALARRKKANASDWPTYRHDGARSGAASVSLPAQVKPAWQEAIPGPLTGVVVAGGRLFVAQSDTHTLHALDADDGSRLWQCTAGGRIDSPPTIHGGFVYFGSADGWVYCVRAADGELAWRFRAAPQASQVVSYGQLESACPVNGSVLVQRDAVNASQAVVYAVAGRSSFLDGGLYLYGLDAQTGKRLFAQRISHRDPQTGREPQETITGKRGTYMPGALPDILSTDGSSLFMRHSRFDLSGKPLPPNVDHLFSPAGFLDDSWWHRTYWLVGSEMLPDYHGWPVQGCVRITGRLLVQTQDRVYGFGRQSYEKAGSHLNLNTQYHLFAADAELGPPKPPEKEPGDWWHSFPGSRVRRIWTKELPFCARAMVLAGDTLFVAGPSDVGDVAAKDPTGDVWLWAVSAKDGTKQAEHKLGASPVFDSFAACTNGLYFTTVDGRIVCYQP